MPVPVTIRRVAADGSGQFLGMEFRALTSAGYVAVADVMYGRAEVLDNFRERRRKGRSLFSGSLQFLTWGVSQTGRAVRVAATARRSSPPPTALPATGDTVVVDKTRFA